jgi:site-specific DNA recombinase
MHYGGKWFPGEHKAIVDRATFDRVQQLLASKSNGRKAKRSESGALLLGKLYDDKDNRMSPSFSSKNGIRYRFYVSSALLRGRQAAVGAIGRIPAAGIEAAVLAVLQSHQGQVQFDKEPDPIVAVKRVVVARDQLVITTASTGDGTVQEIRVPWSAKAKDTAIVQGNSMPDGVRNESLIQSIVRAHAWIRNLHDGKHESIEALAEADHLHPKVVRQAFRLAFLSPDVTSAILEGRQPSGFSLTQIPKSLPLQWTEHRRLFS